jgi:hypothetical protein
MSHSFIRIFNTFTELIFENNARRVIGKNEFAVRVGLLSTIVVGHGLYAYSTEEKESIVVTKKYKMNQHGFTQFMIIDNKGRHFNVNNSLWYWKWDSIEDWHRIEEKSEEKLFIRYYGWRMPFLGIFPNITVSDNSKFLDSMSSAEFIRFESKNLI